MLEGKKLRESIQDGVTHALGGDPVPVAKFREHQKRKLLRASSSPVIASNSSTSDDGSKNNSDNQSADSFIQSLNLKTKFKLFFLRNRYRKYIQLLLRVHGYAIFRNGCFNGGLCHVHAVTCSVAP